MTTSRARALALALMLPLALHPRSAAAQPTSGDRARNLAANGAIGGVAAAVHAALAGKSPLRAFVRGAGGGVLMGAGRQLAASRFDGAGLLGRQLSAIGISGIRAAAADTAAWLVPVGPLKLWVVPRSEDRLRARLNLGEAAMTLYYAVQDDARLDLRATLSSGAPVFRLPSMTFESPDGEAVGRMDGGVIVLGAIVGPYRVSQDVPLAHEAVHVLQLDFATEIVTAPVERRILDRVIGRRASRLVDTGALAPLLLGALNQVTVYGDRPWEQEAMRLSSAPEPDVSGPVPW